MQLIRLDYDNHLVDCLLTSTHGFSDLDVTDQLQRVALDLLYREGANRIWRIVIAPDVAPNFAGPRAASAMQMDHCDFKLTRLPDSSGDIARGPSLLALQFFDKESEEVWRRSPDRHICRRRIREEEERRHINALLRSDAAGWFDGLSPR